jgi:hypothetical protein
MSLAASGVTAAAQMSISGSADGLADDDANLVAMKPDLTTGRPQQAPGSNAGQVEG